MKNYIVYNSNGDILRAGICKDSDLSLQAADGEFILEGTANDATQKIVDGQVVDKDESVDNLELIEEKRAKRNAGLEWCDWTQLPDSPLSDSKKAEWATFRQALRDITSHSNWPNLEEEDWPTEPS